MLSARRFFLGLCLLLAAGLLGLMAFNRLTDQSRVLSGDAEHEYHYPDRKRFDVILANQRYLRVQYLLAEGHRYDSLILGSSRVGSLDTRRLDGAWYTLNYPAGMPYEHLHNLRLLLNAGVVPQRIVLALDRFAFYDPYLHNHVLSPLYPADLRQRLGVLAFYLLKTPTAADLDIARGRAVLRRSYKIVPAAGERHTRQRPAVETQRGAAHEAALLAADPMPFTRSHTRLLLEETLTDLRALEALCDEHGIELRVYMNPFHYKNYLAMDHDELDRIFAALAAWRPFRDFSGLHAPYTLDNRLWNEPSHFVASVNNRMLRIVLGEEPPDGDFGAWVNPDNAAAHRARQKAVIRERLPALQAYDRKLWLHPSVAALAAP